MVFFFLCLISIVEVFSASSELTYKGGSYAAPIIKHIGLLGVTAGGKAQNHRQGQKQKYKFFHKYDLLYDPWNGLSFYPYEQIVPQLGGKENIIFLNNP